VVDSVLFPKMVTRAGDAADSVQLIDEACPGPIIGMGFAKPDPPRKGREAKLRSGRHQRP